MNSIRLEYFDQLLFGINWTSNSKETYTGRELKFANFFFQEVLVGVRGSKFVISYLVNKSAKNLL